MQFKLCTYQDRHYIQYTDAKHNLTFTNAEYFVFDVLSDAFHHTMEYTGGFIANMTTRFMEDHSDLNITRIMLCCIPQPSNKYVFRFVYLDDDNNILDYKNDNNYFDYKYFKEKFKDCIIQEGMIYDLEQIPELKSLTNTFCPHPSVNFDFQIDGQDITFEDTLVCHDLSIFRTEIKENLQKVGAKTIQIRFECNPLSFITLNGIVLNDKQEPIKIYQAYSGIADIDAYLQAMREKYPDYKEKEIDTNNFNFQMNLTTAKQLATEHRLHLASKPSQMPL